MAGQNLPTKKQKQTLDFISGFIKENGYAPSFREIKTALGVKSISTVASHVDGLIAKGFLAKKESGARSLELATPNSTKPSWQKEFIVWSETAELPDDAKQAVELIKSHF